MQKHIWLIPFSPTGNSRRIAAAVASGLHSGGLGAPDTIDLTLPGPLYKKQFAADDLTIFAVPVYAGRVSPLAIERLAGLKGDNTRAIIIVTYGNREFEDALTELQDIVATAGFLPIAAGAFIGEHSFSGPEAPIAAGRPDSADLEAAAAFGAEIDRKLADLQERAIAQSLKVPGNRPYKEGMQPLPFAPVTEHSRCTLCAACLAVCPTGALTLDDRVAIDAAVCI